MIAQKNMLKGKLMMSGNPKYIYSYKGIADELKCDEGEVKKAMESLNLTLPLSRKKLKKVKERIALFYQDKKIESARERDREKEEQEDKKREQMQENSRLNQECKKRNEREKKNVQSNSHTLSASERLQKDAEEIESQNQEGEDTLDFE